MRINATPVVWLAAGLLLTSIHASAITISNLPTGEEIGDFGTPDTLTYGQVFTAPVTGTLDSFTMYLNDGVGALFGGVGTWNGTPVHALGFGSPTNLYQSPDVPSLGGGPYTFNPGISVTAGQLYVAYLSVFGVGGAIDRNPMPLGDNLNPNINYFVFNNSSDPRNNPSWNYFFNLDEFFSTDDVLFSASFSAVPEPGTMMLMGLGLAALSVASRRKLR